LSEVERANSFELQIVQERLGFPSQDRWTKFNKSALLKTVANETKCSEERDNLIEEFQEKWNEGIHFFTSFCRFLLSHFFYTLSNSQISLSPSQILLSLVMGLPLTLKSLSFISNLI
jgi:hypothetical protein